MSWLSSFFHPEKGYDKAQQELDKYWQQAQQFQQPFISGAKETYPGLAEALKKLLNPGGLQDEWNKNYKESDYAKGLESELMDRGLNSAQSMGLGGSSSALQAIQGGTQKVVGQERQQYLDDLMKKYMTGLGLGEDIYGVGAGSAGALGNQAMQMGQNSANMAYGKENAGGDLFSKLLGGGIGLVGSALGGPMGGALSKRWNLAGG